LQEIPLTLNQVNIRQVSFRILHNLSNFLDEHREEFTALIRELKNSFRAEGFSVSVTILPNVNSTLYLDVPATADNIDWLNLATFDVQTPERNKKEVDFPAPLYLPSDRNPELNIDYQVTDLIGRGFPAKKIIVGIPTYGRAWAIKDGATSTGVPPIEGNGPAAEGIQTKKEGLLAYAEICSKLLTPDNKDLKGDQGPLRKVGDPTKRYGTYAYRLPDSSGKFGMWVGYEDPDTAGNKAAYVRAKSLGGVGIFDLTMDDFRGACSGDKFPILRAARYRLV
jgi:chitinase